MAHTSVTSSEGRGSGAIARELPGNDLTDRDAEEILCRTADDIPPAGFDEASGYGRVNIHAALEYVNNHQLWALQAAFMYEVQAQDSQQIVWFGDPFSGHTGPGRCRRSC